MSSLADLSPPSSNEYHAFYQKYVSMADRTDFLKSFESQPQELRLVLGDLESDEVNRLHEPYTWTLKQVMGHLIDCERIFSDRMLRIAVGDKASIPGIDQNHYVANIDYEPTAIGDLLDEFEHLRLANVLLVKRLSTESLARMGTASDNPVSARANLYILAGHVVYHLNIIKQRLA